MNTLEFFLLHHHRLYFESSGIYNRISGLTDDQIRICPNGMNSIVWLLWHVARCEDIGINRLVTEDSQVLDESDWQERLHLFRRDLGTGMSSEEVARLSEEVDVRSLRDYSKTVAEKTQLIVKNLDIQELEIIPDPPYLHKVLFEEGALIKNTEWVAEHYSNKTKGWFLGHLGLTHGKGHLGQIILLRKLIGLGSGE
jgi:hypothetical protein